MIKVVAKCTVKKEHIEDFKKLTSELIDQTRKENGCILYELFQDNDDERIFSFIESWKDQTTLNCHIDSKHCKEILPKMKTTYEKDMELNFYTLVK